MAPSEDFPFVFYHIDKTAGSSLRAIIDEAARRNRLRSVIPCHNHVTCMCASNFAVKPAMCPPNEAFGERQGHKRVLRCHLPTLSL